MHAAAILKEQFESVLWQVRDEPETLACGIPEIRIPRGCLTEIVGPASSGRTTLLHSILALPAPVHSVVMVRGRNEWRRRQPLG